MSRVVIAFCVAAHFIISGCGSTNAGESVPPSLERGHEVYITHCKSCHGSSGDLGLNGALPLSESTISKKESIEVVLKGRNLMVGFEGTISKEDARKVVTYIRSLKK